MTNQRGFSLVETVIATACALMLVFGASTLATHSLRQQLNATSKLDSIQQNSEIKDLLFNLANTSASTCLSRLKLSGSEVFDPSEDFLLPASEFQMNSNGVKIDRIFFSGATLLKTIGSTSQYSAQLRVEQSMIRSTASLKPVTIGAMNLSVNSSGKIVSCSWDDTFVSAMSTCTGSSGTVVGGSSICYMQPEIPIVSSCPTGTSLSDGHCFPSNVDCYRQSLSNDFDGNKFGCLQLAPAYAVRYPAEFQPSEAPGGNIGEYPSPTPTPTPPATCPCGSSTITQGESQKCIRAWSDDDSFFGDGSAYDDMWEVKRCNSAGQLEPDSPNEYVFREEGDGVQYSFKPGTCSYTGSSKNVDGRRYSKGRCQ